ncbi:EipB-like [Rhabdaerophilaceae bacterium]
MYLEHSARRLLALAIFGLGSATGGQGLAQSLPAGPILLQPHRVAYEVSLGERPGMQAFTGARGLMVLEFTGNACDGYATNFRQVVDLLDQDGTPRTLDYRVNLHEDGAGKRFRFTMLNRLQRDVIRDVDGEARRQRDGSLAVAMKKPAGQKSDFDGDVLFPAALSVAMLEAAQKGERSYRAKLFDGAEGGEKIFDVAVTIGNQLASDRLDRIEMPLRSGVMGALARWPISIAYYEDAPGDRVPLYTMRSVTFANGVLGDITFDFPEFALVAKAVKYEPLPHEPCTKR